MTRTGVYNSTPIENNIETVKSFKYLGTSINHTNNMMEEIKLRVTSGNRAFYSLQHVFKSRSISRKTKKTVYLTVVRPAVTYSSETWTLTRGAEHILNRWERKILRNIYGPIQENGVWRSRTNQEILHLYNESTIVTVIKQSRLRWAGHLERMAANRVVKQVHHLRPTGRRLVGRPRLRWIDDVEDDLRRMKIRAWRRKSFRSDRVDLYSEAGRNPTWIVAPLGKVR